MSPSYQHLINQISAKHKIHGESLQPGCSAKGLADLQARARRELGIEIPPGYADFLRLNDGFDWNGLFIYASKTVPVVGYKDRFIYGFVDANQWFRDEDDGDDNEWKRKFVLFGGSSLDFYMYEPETDNYSTRDRISLDEFESYSSFEEMITEALRKHL